MANFNIDYLVVAGGGGGARSAFTTGGASGGGGGAGEFLYKTSQTLTTEGSGYTVTIGDGGNAGVSGVSATNGGNSVFIDTTLGGGYGGTANSSTYSPGASGGSGGGSGINGSTVYAGGSSTTTSPGLGNAGGASTSASSAYGSGGGGGAGTAGSNGTSSTGGNGGTGVQNSITSTATFYAGGGGGGSFNNNNVGSGGSGVGGNANARAAGSPGTSNTGSGGGGGSYSGSAHTNGAPGGSGIVILRYPTADVASYTATGLTPTETIDGTDTILSFTTVGTGTITFAAPAPAPPITPFDGTKVTTPVTGFNKINTTQGLKLPSGDNSNQPLGAAAEQGMIRNDTEETVNSSASALAHYNGTNWQYFAATESPDPIVYSTFAAWDVGNTISYNGTGNTLYNIVNNPTGFNFTKYGGVSYDGANNSFNFNGATGSAGAYMRFSQSAMNIPNEYTVSMWVNFTAFPTNTTLYAYGYTPSLRQFLSSTQMRYYVTPGPSGNYTPFFNHGMTTGNWYNITMVFTTTTVKTYISQEGNSTATLKQTATTSHGANQNTNDLYFGCNVSNYNSNFNGQLRIMEIYDSQLNQTDIDFIVNQGSQR